jgi:ABC-type dipeptide/oligopeptide/nickel transport system permease component
MYQTVLKRLLSLPLLLLVLVTVVFLMVRLIPGDPAMLMAGSDATDEQIEAIRVQMGLDQPLWGQYYHFIANLVSGDLGNSVRSGQPALQWALQAVQYSAVLACASMAIALLIGVPAGIVAATRRGTFLDTLIVVGSLLGVSIPVYISALLLVLVFGVTLGLLPIAGASSPVHWILPSFSVGLILSGELARITRSAMLDVLSQDYMRTAKAKGVPYRTRIVKHGLRNASIPILSVAGEQFAHLFGAAVLTETIFALPGLGRLLINAIEWRDYPLIQACILVFGTIVILVNLLTDISYHFVDPRLR